VLFGSEEIGLLGSAFYVDSLTSAEEDAIEAMLNFDMLAVGEDWPFLGSRQVVDIASAEADKLGIPHSTQASLPGGAGSDHGSFIDAGIPAMIFNCLCDDNWHTAGDTFENIEETRLAEAGLMGMGTAEAILAD
jgi:Zn-dependent M28 family amino/carboxypeptidase